MSSKEKKTVRAAVGNKENRIENYVFDLYGTLIDIRTDEEDIWAWKRLALFYRYQGADYKAKELKKAYEKAVQEALRESASENKESLDTAEIRIEEIFRKLYEDKEVEPEEGLVFDTCRMFRIVTTRRIKLFPGVKKSLQGLKDGGARLYLLSNAQRAFTEKELEMFGLEKYFDGIVLSSDRGVKKPGRKFFDYLIETYHLDSARTLMIGDDRRCDIEGAVKAGMDGFFVGQGKQRVRAQHCRKKRSMTEKAEYNRKKTKAEHNRKSIKAECSRKSIKAEHSKKKHKSRAQQGKE